MFYVGQKVVRIGPTISPVVVRGQVYTIVGFAPCQHSPHLPAGLMLAGVKNEQFRNGAPKGFNPCRFRPLCDKKTDISVFTALLDTAKAPQHA